MSRTHSYIKYLGLWLCVLSSLLSGHAWAVACDAVFAGGVQSHDANGVVHLEYETRIYGGGTVLQTPLVTMSHDYLDQRGMCHESLGDASVCTASGQPGEKSAPLIPTHSYMPTSFLTSPSDSSNVEVPYQGNQTLNRASHGTVSVGQEAVLTLSSVAPSMTMNDVTTYYNSTIEFDPGSYWINGDLTLAELTRLRRLGSQQGAVTLYISGQLIAGGSAVTLQNFSDDRPLNIYAFGNMTFGNNIIISGNLYSHANIYLGMGSRVSQGVYAAQVGTGVDVQLSYAALHQEHFLGGLTLNSSQVEVNFQPGDYYFDGDLDIGVAAVLRNLRGSDRPVRFFVNGDINLQHDVSFENFSDGQLLLYATGNIDIKSQNDVRAFIYAAGDVRIDFSGNSRYIGGISGTNVTIGQGSIVQHVNPVDLGAFCDDEVAVAYYGLSHATLGLTCMAEAITITAYDTDHQPVAPAEGTQLTLGTTPATGAWVGSNSWIFSGEESSVVKYLQQTSPDTLSLWVSDDKGVGGISELTFLDTALKFYGDNPLTNPAPISPSVAGVDAYAYLWAVRTNTDTGACEGRVSGGQSVNLAFECRNPDECVAGQSLLVDGSPAQPNPADSGINYATVPLSFDANGMAAVPLNYSDVGQVRLHAQLPLPASGNNPAITLAGSSNEFVVKPYTLVVSAVTSASNTPNPGTTNSGDGFVAAGEVFHAQIEVRNAQGNLTPNFGNETNPESVRAELENLVYPAGGNGGVLNGTNSFVADTTPGRFISQSLSWNEAGSIEFLPALVGNDYLGAGEPVEHISSGTVGRFYPSAFHLASHSVVDACTGFSYLSQPQLSVNYRLEARAQGGNITRNYDSQIYTGTADSNYVAEHNQSGDGATWTAPLRLDIEMANWASGVMQVNDDSAMVRRLATGPDGPYNSLQLGVQLQGDLDNRPLNGLNISPLSAGSCSGSDCTAITIGNPIAVRFGRLRLDSAHGPETNNLPVKFITEYWDGQRFVRAYEDQCTHISRAAINYPAGPISTDANRRVTVGGGTTEGNYRGLRPSDITFLSGDAGHVFTAPGRGNTGSFEVNVDLLDLPWLRYDWNQDGNHDNDTALPPATISFGSYRGHDRVIYWRELLE